MTFVNITALTYPGGAEEEIEQRFAARKRAVDKAPGFQSFELLRPVFGENRYFVVTRWDSREDYQNWSDNRVGADHSDDERRGMKIDLLGFEVIQHDENS